MPTVMLVTFSSTVATLTVALLLSASTPAQALLNKPARAVPLAPLRPLNDGRLAARSLQEDCGKPTLALTQVPTHVDGQEAHPKYRCFDRAETPTTTTTTLSCGTIADMPEQPGTEFLKSDGTKAEPGDAITSAAPITAQCLEHYVLGENETSYEITCGAGGLQGLRLPGGSEGCKIITYTVQGTVKEQGGGPVAGVQVTIKFGDSAGDTAAAVTTDANGVWTAELRGGQFMLEARAAGFILGVKTIQVTGRMFAGDGGTEMEIQKAGSGTPVTARTMQMGYFSMIDSYGSDLPNSFEFDRPFESPPVVFILATNQGGDAAAVRTYGATVKTFQAWTVEPHGNDGPHAQMTTSYLAAQPGVHRLTDGRYLEVGTLNTKEWIGWDKTDPKWQKITFSHDFGDKPPALLTGVTSFNNERNALPSEVSDPWLSVGVQGLTGQGAEVILDNAETNTGDHIVNEETIGWIAFEQGIGELFDNEGNEVTLASLVSEKIVRGWNDGFTNVPYPGTVGGDNLVAGSVVTRTDSDGGWLRVSTRSSTYASVCIDEDLNKEGERNHSPEQVALIVASGSFSM